MKTSNPFCFAALKIRSMFSTVLFSVTLSPTNGHARPLSLKTSFCGSIKTTAVSFLLMSIVFAPFCSYLFPTGFHFIPLHLKASRRGECLTLTNPRFLRAAPAREHLWRGGQHV